MKKNKWVKGLCLTILAATVGGGSLAYAEKDENSSISELKAGDQIPSQNQRQKMQHSQRKEAAQRLKAKHYQTRAKEMADHAGQNDHNRSSK